MKISIFWFRRDLRLSDNHGLYQALKSGNKVLPIFIFDKEILEKLPDTKDKRVAFIHNTLSLLKSQLEDLGSSLLVLHETPTDAFKNLSEKYTIDQVFANHDYEPSAIRRDHEIGNFLTEKNIGFSTFKDQVIFEKNEVLKADGKPYTIFTPYSRIWKQKLSSEKITNYPSEELSNQFFITDSFPLPSLGDIGFEPISEQFPAQLLDEKIISDYHNTRNLPAVKGTTNLSVHLRFGTVSTRMLVQKALALNDQWLNELIWREFFMMILYHFPYVQKSAFKSKYDNIIWRNNEAEFENWCKGKTGYPIVDAGMHELNTTGLMHNRVRMIVASFLCKHLLIDYRWGEAYFASKLLDFDLSANNGNWQWAAGCGCDAAPYFRVFSPDAQTSRFDPKLSYIKKWVDADQLHFLQPIVIHDFARKRALETYKKYL